jgi:hypothetical protein
MEESDAMAYKNRAVVVRLFDVFVNFLRMRRFVSSSLTVTVNRLLYSVFPYQFLL